MKLIIVSLMVIISGCSHPPDIIQVGDCEHGIVSKKNVTDVQKVWKDAQLTDVLISGGCYQNKFIKKSK